MNECRFRDDKISPMLTAVKFYEQAISFDCTRNRRIQAVRFLQLRTMVSSEQLPRRRFQCGLRLVSVAIVLIIAEVAGQNSTSSSNANTKFAFSLYKLVSQTTGNVFVSPLSAQIILGLAHAGARGETARQIADAILLPDDRDFIKNEFSGLLQSIQEQEGYLLDIANNFYVRQDFPVEEDFRLSAQTSFLADTEEVDFSESESARQMINSWVESKTKGKIKNFLSPGAVDSETMLFLVNAVYFKGYWARKFNPSNTKKRPFFLDAGQTVEVDTMKQENDFLFYDAKELQAQVLELPYKGKKLSLYVFLPYEKNGLNQLEEKLVDENVLPGIMEKLRSQAVNVVLPKFQFDQTVDMKGVLKKMGMTDMFTTEADFSGISQAARNSSLHVSNVIQKAFIEVDEEGSQATGASGMLVVVPLSLPLPPVEFIADHPFLFMIQEKTSGVLLFLGSVRNPAAQPSL